jgi:hypothetical protein
MLQLTSAPTSPALQRSTAAAASRRADDGRWGGLMDRRPVMGPRPIDGPSRSGRKAPGKPRGGVAAAKGKKEEYPQVLPAGKSPG